ncbi:SRPBCC family protein [Xylophilus sp. GOD-11R]|uniref:SRPBCC family protein n=1 Tax=Xylophilus sp. GOD-11R TaxID=3089814 RepID=UPI00298D180A|nr:SRPBCC family protein [Xylophilus sp. GOD-11R]WPB58104.1 SRPBCC family protein [Xylophilus sp. GOD-11R]
MHPFHIVSQNVDRAANDVYDFARRIENLPRWASGLAAGVSQENGEWFTDSPMGRVRLRMAEPNPFGVLDHDVTLPDGTTVHNAFRVTPAGTGSVLSFVVLALPGSAPELLEQDAAHVAKDLVALKTLMEQP